MIACKDCKHCMPEMEWMPRGKFHDWLFSWRFTFAKCAISGNKKKLYDYGNGIEVKRSTMKHCQYERTVGNCGPQGIRFEPRA